MQNLTNHAEWLAGFFERRWREYLILFSVIYWVCMGVHASQGRYFWYDELFTYHVASLESWPTILAALVERADFHPPLTYLLGHAGMRIVGDEHLGLRLPGLICFWLMSLSIFFFVRRRVGALMGAAAMLVPFACYAREVATEARGYPLLLGFTACALLSWQLAADGKYRPASLAVLAGSLFCAVASHWNGVLSFLPIVSGEAVRTWEQRRIDRPVWLSIAAGALVLPALLPQILAASKHAPDFWAKPSIQVMLTLYGPLLEGLINPLLFSAALITLMVRFPSTACPPSSQSGTGCRCSY